MSNRCRAIYRGEAYEVGAYDAFTRPLVVLSDQQRAFVIHNGQESTHACLVPGFDTARDDALDESIHCWIHQRLPPLRERFRIKLLVGQSTRQASSQSVSRSD